MQTKTRIDRTIFKDAIKYKAGGKRVFIKKESDNEYLLRFQRVIKLDDIEKEQYRKNNSIATILIERKHSQLCIWQNDIKLSLFALECLHNSLEFIKYLTINKV